MGKNVDVDGIRSAANRHLRESGGTATELAEQAGISKGRLSEFLRGTYKGNNVATASRLNVVVAEKLALSDIIKGNRELFYVVQYQTKHGLNFAKTKSSITAQTWLATRQSAVGWTQFMDPTGKQAPICWPWAGGSNEAN